VDWIHLAEDRVYWQALVNTAMNFLIPQVRLEVFTAMKICCGFLVCESVDTNMEACFSETMVIYRFWAQD
jgi:hypothetical protein